MIEQTKTIIQAFEARIKELLAEGYSAQQAVRRAYEEYPVMKALQEEVEGSLHNIAELGYGGVLANSVTDKAFKAVWAPDRLTLSTRTTRGAKAIRDMVAETLSRQMVRNANYKQNALDLFDGYGYGHIIPEQDIPEFMSKLVKLSNGPNYNKEQFRSAIRQAERQIKRQGMEVAYKSLLEAIEARNDQALHKALYMAIQERTRYFAERIARTERARAFIDGFLAKWQDDEDCVAYQWKLSTAHPKHDICDLYANADLYGLGKGVYPKDKVPSIPVHPHCMCRLKPLFEGQIPDIAPKERIEEGGREYIATLSRKQKEQLLGVYGSREVEAGVSWTAKAKGYNNHVLIGRIKFGFKGIKYYNKIIEYENRRANILIASDGTIKPTKIYDRDKRHKVTVKAKPNSVIYYWSKGGQKGIKQLNYSVYDMQGKLLLQYHFGHHGYPNKHNWGTKEEPDYLHKHFYDIVDGNIIEGIGLALTNEERRYSNDY